MTNGNYSDMDYTGYHQSHDIDDPESEPCGSFEVFIVPNPNWAMDQDTEYDPGYYWWACSPGCLPDGEPIGPFETSAEAYHDAQGY
jgi:hypothetical protein